MYNFCHITWLLWSGKSERKITIFQGQGKIMEFCIKSGKFLIVTKVSEKSISFQRSPFFGKGMPFLNLIAKGSISVVLLLALMAKGFVIVG